MRLKAEKIIESDIEQYLRILESLQIVHRYKNLIDFSIANLRIYGHILVRSNKVLNKKVLKINDKNFTAAKKIKKKKKTSATFDF